MIMAWRAGGKPGLIRTKLSRESDALLSRLVGEAASFGRLAEELGTNSIGLTRLLDGGSATPELVTKVETALANKRKAV
jgi:hypothetical protein